MSDTTPTGYSPLVERLFAGAADAAGPLPGSPSAADLRGEAGSTARGAWVVFHVRPAAGRIAAMTFEAWGCPVTIAACAYLARELVGQPLSSLKAQDMARLRAMMAAPPGRLGRLLIVEDALRNCLTGWDNASPEHSPED